MLNHYKITNRGMSNRMFRATFTSSFFLCSRNWSKKRFKDFSRIFPSIINRNRVKMQEAWKSTKGEIFSNDFQFETILAFTVIETAFVWNSFEYLKLPNSSLQENKRVKSREKFQIIIIKITFKSHTIQYNNSRTLRRNIYKSNKFFHWSSRKESFQRFTGKYWKISKFQRKGKNSNLPSPPYPLSFKNTPRKVTTHFLLFSTIQPPLSQNSHVSSHVYSLDERGTWGGRGVRLWKRDALFS